MRWLKGIAPMLILFAFGVLVLVTLISDHTDEYGQVAIPQGGVVTLPQGDPTIYVAEPGSGESERKLSQRLRFEVSPATGGEPLTKEATGKYGSDELQGERSQDFGESGSVAQLQVPAAGEYAVRGSFGDGSVPATLSFGRDSFTAVADRWRLWALLVGAAVLIWLIPTPRKRRGAVDHEMGAIEPYAGPPPYS